jgi:antitoxin VapB
VIKAVRGRLARVRGGRSRIDELQDIAEACARLPVRDGREADEILGYGDDGLPR